MTPADDTFHGPRTDDPFWTETIWLDLRFEGTHEPIARTTGDAVVGLNQSCHVTGSIRLNSDVIDVDCHELRARSWGPRSDARWSPRSTDDVTVPGFSDTFGMSADTAFVIGTAGTIDRTTAHSGFYRRDNAAHQIVSGVRVIERAPGGYAERVIVDAVDDAGRTLHAEGTCVNNFLMQATPGVRFWVNGTRWVIDGTAIWGCDHDVPGRRTARHALRRAARDSRPGAHDRLICSDNGTSDNATSDNASSDKASSDKANSDKANSDSATVRSSQCRLRSVMS